MWVCRIWSFYTGLMDKTLFDFLLEQSPDAGVSQQDENGNTPLLALFVNMPETGDYDRRPYVKKLLELNSDVNAVNKEGLPVLAAAIMAGMPLRQPERPHGVCLV